MEPSPTRSRGNLEANPGEPPLSILLEGFRGSTLAIYYSDIAKRLWGEESDFIDVTVRNRISEVKGALDDYLEGMVTEILKAVKGMDYYRIEKQIPYYWIRCEDGSSRLGHDPP